MGFNTAMSFCNDMLADYERDPERFVQIVRDGINDGANRWGIIVHPSLHADDTQLIAVGQNSSTRVYTGYYLPSHHNRDGQVELLKQWADELGFTVSKKRGAR